MIVPSAEDDHVVVHEPRHLPHMVHSPRLWAMVARAIQDYRRRRHSLDVLQGNLPL